jgi:hypothetical protein
MTQKETRIRKPERLLRYHRQNVFDDCEFKADCHSRALRRLKASKTFAEGEASFHRGDKRSSNPHKKPIQRRAWADGWDMALDVWGT